MAQQFSVMKMDFDFTEVCPWGSLTHWGRVTHICVSKLTTIGSDNGLSPGRRQAIIWTNAGILLIGPLGTNFSEILIEILTRKCVWKCRLRNGGHLVSASMCFNRYWSLVQVVLPDGLAPDVDRPSPWMKQSLWNKMFCSYLGTKATNIPILQNDTKCENVFCFLRKFSW